MVSRTLWRNRNAVIRPVRLTTFGHGRNADFNEGVRAIPSPGTSITTRGTHQRRRTFFSSVAQAINFSCAVSGTSCTVTGGSVRLHSVGVYAIATVTVPLVGDPSWVCVEHARNGSSDTIQVYASEPISNADVLRIPLCKFSLSGSSYVRDMTCWQGDINLDTPLQ